MNNFERELEAKKMEILSIVAFGCNKNATSTLKDVFKKHRCDTFYFYEYFPLIPIRRDRDSADSLSQAFFAPYLERILSRCDFVPDLSGITQANFPTSHNDIKYVPAKKSARSDFIAEPVKINRLSHLKGGRVVYQYWEDHRLPPMSSANRKWNFTIEQINEDEYRDFFFVKGWYLLKYLDECYVTELSQRRDRDKVEFLKDFLLVVKPWLSTRHRNDDKLRVIYTPIASPTVFYGYLLVFFKDQPSDRQKRNEYYNQLMKALHEIAHTRYLPILTLFENYWEEYVIKEGLEGEHWRVQSWRRDVVQLKRNRLTASQKLVFLDENTQAATLLEQKLHQLWIHRRSNYNSRLTQQRKRDLIEHLVFAKYNVGSPRMLELVEKAATLNLKKVGKELPSVLVIGGPGSGKDTLAKLVALFSEHYGKGTIYSINMAAYKPEMISTPLLTGLAMNGYIINGLFGRLVNKPKTTLILDELNSLDIDAQGALLRIIENGELVQVGAIDPIAGPTVDSFLDILIVGVMNEDPDKLTKESTLKQILTQEKLFGGAVGEILYEYVRSIRRLREDLYYRLKRGGKLEVPDLSDRREDIPILFYLSLMSLKKSYNTVNEVKVSMDAYDELMSDALEWPGNVRQLQAVATTVLNNKAANSNAVVEVDREDVRYALIKSGMMDII